LMTNEFTGRMTQP